MRGLTGIIIAVSLLALSACDVNNGSGHADGYNHTYSGSAQPEPGIGDF